MLWRRAARHPVSVFDTAGFILPLTDLGAGAVNLVLQRGVGVATFTRATVAWTKLASGLWAQIASGTARSCYLGATTAVGAYGGYFAEAAGTQLVTPTASIRDMTQAAWIKVTMTTDFTSTGIGGVASSCTRLTATGANSTILQTLVAAATSRTYSCWVKRITGSGTVLLKQGTATLDITALINSSTFTLVQLNDNELNVAFGLQINTSGDAIDVDFNQFEAGAIATSPMDAAGAVRNDDQLTYPTSGNILGTSGSAYVEATWANQGGYVHNNTTNRGMLFQSGVTLQMYDGTTAVNGPTVATTSATIVKLASSWGGVVMNSFAAGVAGTPGAFDGNFDLDANFVIGNRGAGVGGDSWIHGMIRNVRLWTTQLSDEQLQGITA